ncbi:hypothetical protein J8F10_06585 [Gemmata sp. G18]|uniref:Uncharacterized protein n=1 Tax=Gemmata palustris TaxID=2822762 RepID=A0ABS5BML3_9BACT|nr:hypothetical protein [Gemmata palustris]MBP3954947.1 hypothetical protein [Gemmata palustris]
MTTEPVAGAPTPAPTATPDYANLIAALKSFDAGDIKQAATDMIEGLQLHIDRGLRTPEDLWYKVDRVAEVLRFAWMLEMPLENADIVIDPNNRNGGRR